MTLYQLSYIRRDVQYITAPEPGSAPRGPEAALSPGRSRQLCDLDETGRHHRQHHQLGDPITPVERDRFDPVIDQDHPDLPPVPGVDHSGGIDHTERLEAVLDEDREYLTLKSGPLLRELRYLSPGTVDMDIVDFPDSSKFFRVPDIGEMAVISQGLDQVGDRTLIRVGEKKIQFISGDEGDVFKYTTRSDENEDKGIEIEVMTKHLVTIGEHLTSGGKCDLYIRKNSPVLIENPVGPGTRVLYLMAHVA